MLGDAGVTVHSLSIHPRLVGTDDHRAAELSSILGDLPVGIPVNVSHLGAHHYVEVRERHRERPFGIRLGSALWHGDKSCFSLRAKALDVRQVRRGETVGYRGGEVPGDGSLVIVDAGSAHGVQPLANGDSPFHFARRRLALLESPHMHVSMVFVPAGASAPTPGDELDVQRPLITTAVDQIRWL
jgi:alanine racemase